MKRWFGALCALAMCAAAGAENLSEAQIPPSLRDWRPWVLNDLGYRACPWLANQAPESAEHFICAWPGKLALNTNAQGATFTVRWRVEAPTWVVLPGNGEHWPQQVTVNGQRLPVLARGGGEDDENRSPALWLTPGSYQVEGRIPWHEQPQTLRVPQDIGLIALTVDGKTVAPIQRDGGDVTLGRAAAATAPEADSIELRVYRKLTDGVPGALTTRVQFNVSGQAREETLGPALPPGFSPVALQSPWPARLDGDGKLRVQVQPGSAVLLLEARADAALTKVSAKPGAEPWPAQEIWSYEAAPRLRVTAASGALQVDPRQAEVPGEWQALPAFALADAATLTIEERSRGLAADAANRLSLQREAWLDFSGSGWYARDRVVGDMLQGWRLDVAAPFTLEQATALNARQSGGEPLLITRGAKTDESGVEWRTPRVDLGAGVRIAAPASMPIAGWQQTFDSVQATLHFPYGYKLLAAPGADSASGSWIAGWNLIDVFLCAIVVLLAWRLLGASGALVTIAYLLLGYQEPARPLWTLLAVFAFALIVRALPAGRLALATEWLRRAALVLLVLVGLWFVTAQVRYALYPQLEPRTYAGYATPGGFMQAVSVAPPAQDAYGEIEEEKAMPASAPQVLDARPVSGDAVAEAPPPPEPMRHRQSRAQDKLANVNAPAPAREIAGSAGVSESRAKKIEHYSENTVVQTGRGAPNWSIGSSAALSWSGPVLASQSVRLLLAPPWLVRPLRLVLCLLLAWLVWRLVRSRAAPPPARAVATGAAAVFACMLGVGAPHAARAQGYPSDELLQHLREHLLEAPRCAPSCATLASAEVAASGDAASVALEVHAGERVAVPLPSDESAAPLRSVTVDGANEEALARDAQGVLWVALGRGVHRVQLTYAAGGDKLALAFPLRPARVLFQGKGWEASGLSDDRLLTETLTLVRAHDAARGTAPDAGVQQFPPYVRVQRNLSLGLEWSVSTEVQRVSPAQGGFTVEVPALPGEHVATAGIKVQNGKIPAAIAEGAVSASWQSTLDRGDTLTLTAPPLDARSEVWTVLVSPTWHVDFSGVPGVGTERGEDVNDFRRFEFNPLPGETLTLKVTRPAPAQGAARAIDVVSLVTQSGQRAATHTLAFTIRASQGGDQVMTLPPDSELLGVTRDNQALNLRLSGGKLSLPIVPGAHNYQVSFRDATPIGAIARTPAVDLGMAAANVTLALHVPADRWLLAAFGPPLGPAVLYWGELVVLIGVAFGLSRTRRTRLGFGSWLLLGLGFSTFSWFYFALVVAWIFALDWRARSAVPVRWWLFNLLQMALAVLTAVALIALVSTITRGLLGNPDMHVTGNGSSAYALSWFTDASGAALPQASALTLPLWVYKLAMLAWALWLANAVLGWLREGFVSWTAGGYWRAQPRGAAAAPAAPVAAPPQAPTP